VIDTTHEEELIKTLWQTEHELNRVYLWYIRDESFNLIENIDKINIVKFLEFLTNYYNTPSKIPSLRIQEFIYNVGKYKYSSFDINNRTERGIIKYIMHKAHLKEHFMFIYSKVLLLTIENIKDIFMNDTDENLAYREEIIVIRRDLNPSFIEFVIYDHKVDIYGMTLIGNLCANYTSLSIDTCRILQDIEYQMNGSCKLLICRQFRNVFKVPGTIVE
jgi:hypothetical protein